MRRSCGSFEGKRGRTRAPFSGCRPPIQKTKKTVLPVFFLIPGAGPDVKGAEGGETENFCPVLRKGQKISVDRTLDRRDTGHAAAEGRRENHIFPPAFPFSIANRAFWTSRARQRRSRTGSPRPRCCFAPPSLKFVTELCILPVIPPETRRIF